MRATVHRWLFAVAVVAGAGAGLSCGGTTAASAARVDAGDAGDATAEAETPDTDAGRDADGAAIEEDVTEAAPMEGGYVIVDGGSDCGLVPLPAHHVQTQTCCNGTACQGVCVLAPEASAPTCLCAGQVGGCPAPMVCCEVTALCSGPQCCTAADGCQSGQGL
jgi:hypothetical protein